MSYLSDLPQPHPLLSPQDVIKIQLDALQNNDLTRDDAGIKLAFNFASPDNRVSTGPLERFITMFKNPLYKSLIGFERAELGTMRSSDGIAQQYVQLYRPHGEVRGYVFTVRLQEDGSFADCWMTEGVIPAK